MARALFVFLSVVLASVAHAQDGAVIHGTMDPALIRRAIHRGAGEALRRCYSEQLRAQPRLEGRWRARFVITADGRIASIETIDSNLTNVVFEQCAMEAIRGASFPAAPGATVVTWTFELVNRPPRSPPRIQLDARGPFVIAPLRR